MVLPDDWQTTKQKVAQRGKYLLEKGQWSDCKFIVGQGSDQQVLEGHKVFLAMSSPVFEAMFFGGMAEKSDPIPIKDVQPEAFKALLEYIYTDEVQLGSFELACELCYCAKKYMIPHLVKKCTEYLWSDLSPKKACRAYEFAKLFEEPTLMDKCLEIMCSKTNEVINESSWDEVEQSTLLTLLDQEELHIQSEVDLLNAVERWAKAECVRKSVDATDTKSIKSVIGDALTKIRFLTLTPHEFAEGPAKSLLLNEHESFNLLMNISSRNCDLPMPEGFSTKSQSRMNFLNMQVFNTDFSKKRSPPVTMFGRCPYDLEERSMNTVTSSSFLPFIIDNMLGGGEQSHPVQVQIPERHLEENNETPEKLAVNDNEYRNSPKYYCSRTVEQLTEVHNRHILECSVSFFVDKNICVLGLQVPSQILNMPDNTQPPKTSYNEALFAELLDSYNTRLTYTHFTTKIDAQGLIDVMFDRPVYIQKNKLYKVGVIFNRVGWYPIANFRQLEVCNHVLFRFPKGNTSDTARDGLIRTIIFTYR